MDIFLIIVFIYLLIGLILFYFQEQWIDENDDEFNELVRGWDWVKYFALSVIIWLPDLIEFWITESNNKEK